MLTFLTGFIASIAHVATGPDHLAAVTPLAIDSRKKSWIVGLLWGLGHTIGMLLIGLLFVIFKELLPIEAISRHSDTVIGFLLIGIGSWALLRIYFQHKHGYRPHIHFHTRPFLYTHIHKHTHPVPPVVDHHDHHEHIHEAGHHHDHVHQEADAHPHPHKPDHRHPNPVQVKQHAFSALIIGIIHGFAGFSHLFALLPSLALPTMVASVIYVIAFASGTILTMVVFAFILGVVAFRSELKQQQIFLKWFSFTGAVLAIVIGVIWIFHPIG